MGLPGRHLPAPHVALMSPVQPGINPSLAVPPPSFPRVASEPAAGFQTHDGGAEISRYGPRGTGGVPGRAGGWGGEGQRPSGLCSLWLFLRVSS